MDFVSWLDWWYWNYFIGYISIEVFEKDRRKEEIGNNNKEVIKLNLTTVFLIMFGEQSFPVDPPRCGKFSQL